MIVYLTAVRMAEINNTKTYHAGKDVEYEKYSYIVDENANLYRHYGN